MELSQKCKDYIKDHYQEAVAFLETLAQIPAPSHHEEKRVAFCKEWLLDQGIRDIAVDSSKNLLIFLDCQENCDLTVFMAHSDVVFPDITPLPLKKDENRLYCPGIGDDTWNVVCLLFATRYLWETQSKGRDRGILVVMNSCEEGLGNLLGCRSVMETYGDRVKEFVSFDSWNGKVYDSCVGSQRYRITLRTVGGHSYEKFGNPNAIHRMATLIQRLYQVEVPTQGKTTYNVGLISGGTSVNTIAQEAEILYEFRSDSATSLAFIDAQFQKIIEEFRGGEQEIELESLGIRPCMGDVDPKKQADLAEKALKIVQKYNSIPPTIHKASTDCNIPLSMGIPSVCLGCFNGDGAHTREEYVEVDSLLGGLHVAFEMMQSYTREDSADRP